MIAWEMRRKIARNGKRNEWCVAKLSSWVLDPGRRGEVMRSTKGTHLPPFFLSHIDTRTMLPTWLWCVIKIPFRDATLD